MSDTPDPTPPAPRPPGLVAADVPLADLGRAHQALNTPAPSAPGVLGKLVDRLLAGRDRRAADATTAVGDAVTDAAEQLAQRLADTQADLDRRLAELDHARRVDADDLAHRLHALESELVTTRAELDGALEQDRITAGVVADAERRLADQLGGLRARVDDLAAGTDRTDEADPP